MSSTYRFIQEKSIPVTIALAAVKPALILVGIAELQYNKAKYNYYTSKGGSRYVAISLSNLLRYLTVRGKECDSITDTAKRKYCNIRHYEKVIKALKHVQRNGCKTTENDQSRLECIDKVQNTINRYTKLISDYTDELDDIYANDIEVENATKRDVNTIYDNEWMSKKDIARG